MDAGAIVSLAVGVPAAVIAVASAIYARKEARAASEGVELARLIRREERWGAYAQALAALIHAKEVRRALVDRTRPLDRVGASAAALASAREDETRARRQLHALLPTVPGLAVGVRAGLESSNQETEDGQLADARAGAEGELQRITHAIDGLRGASAPPAGF